MFVKDNSVQGVFAYFQEKLKSQFSEREIKYLAKNFICKRLNWSATNFITQQKRGTVSESDLLYFRDVIKEISSGVPYQYVIGDTFFYNSTLGVNENVLIPRPETEELVDWIISDFKNESKIFLDIGTGSGCIPIAIKKERSKFDVYGLDVSPSAIDLANKNAEKNEVDIILLVHDILDVNIVDKLPQKIDIIVSNPPYIPEKEKAEMKDHVVKYEPEIALFVPDNDPLIFYRLIAKIARERLVENGHLYLEIHENLSADVVKLLTSENFTNIELRKDLQGKNRMVKAKK